MDYKDTMNTILLSLTHYFNVCRMPELAIANILALMTMNYESNNRARSTILNATFTYLMGYPFFLEGKPTQGVYMFLLGVLCILSTLSLSFSEILEDWNARFRLTKQEENTGVNVEEDSLEEDSSEDEAQHPNPTSASSDADAICQPYEVVASSEQTVTDSLAPAPEEEGHSKTE